MRVGQSDRNDRNKDKKKKKKSTIESEVLSIMEKSLKTAMELALDDLFKDWK